ncbi:DUF502 domain-containing protein [Natranaeroarchaeum aerophilus]|uniref:DUF502 domain-containing protein n=1 Tax=Natranaeroarchaeum aerophilus TaxID=2917711 RepID=A0AAE3FR18_9EURY|nr:DUF502 domain-containing protein [Natranaeroarchaeum aerophilus]MCL9813049.1 DUF502 domain-containing protein [Natranaeroarchaeum aerophilus]
MTTWKRDFGSGLVVLVPIIVTLWVVIWLAGFIAGLPFVAAIDADLLATVGLGWLPTDLVRVVVTLFVFVLLVFAVGYLMRTALGGFAESALDDLVNRLPGLRVVYNASKMAAETALGGTDALQTPVKIEPWDDMRLTAFKTGKQTSDGREILFMPTAPNITTGFVVEVKSEDIKEVDERVEEALTRLLSAGFGDSNGNGPGSQSVGGIPIDVQEAADSEYGRLDPRRVSGGREQEEHDESTDVTIESDE